MKKLLIFLIIPILSFFSCEPDDGEANCMLIGDWRLNYEENLETENTSCFCNYPSVSCDVYHSDCPFVIFLDNGESEWHAGNGPEIVQWSGCSIGGEIIFVNGEEETIMSIVSLSETNCVLQSDNYIGYFSKIN